MGGEEIRENYLKTGDNTASNSFVYVLLIEENKAEEKRLMFCMSWLGYSICHALSFNTSNFSLNVTGMLEKSFTFHTIVNFKMVTKWPLCRSRQIFLNLRHNLRCYKKLYYPL